MDAGLWIVVKNSAEITKGNARPKTSPRISKRKNIIKIKPPRIAKLAATGLRFGSSVGRLCVALHGCLRIVGFCEKSGVVLFGG